MLEANAIIERVRSMAGGFQQLDVAVQKSQAAVGAGQLFLVRATESFDPLLREPWTPVHRNGQILTFERPATRLYTPSQIISLLGPIGTPLPVRSGIRALLLVAVDATPAALMLLAEASVQQGAAVTLVLAGSARRYPLEVLPPEIEVTSIESLSQWPTREEQLKWAEQIFVVAPFSADQLEYMRLLEYVRLARLNVPPKFIYGLYQPPMPCGIGTCQACLIPCGGEDVPTCIDGPAFDLLTTIKGARP